MAGQARADVESLRRVGSPTSGDRDDRDAVGRPTSGREHRGRPVGCVLRRTRHRGAPLRRGEVGRTDDARPADALQLPIARHRLHASRPPHELLLGGARIDEEVRPGAGDEILLVPARELHGRRDLRRRREERPALLRGVSPVHGRRAEERSHDRRRESPVTSQRHRPAWPAARGPGMRAAPRSATADAAAGTGCRDRSVGALMRPQRRAGRHDTGPSALFPPVRRVSAHAATDAYTRRPLIGRDLPRSGSRRRSSAAHERTPRPLCPGRW